MNTFLASLYETGQMWIDDDSSSEPHLLESDLLAIDASVRLELPGTAPDLDLPSACWAATLLYNACKFVYVRSIATETIQQDMAVPCPGRLGPDIVYSVDLSFRFLPSLLVLASHLSPKDPLVGRLHELAHDWPFSSAGGIEINPDQLNLEPILGNACLRQAYADRVFLAKDRRRAHHPVVKTVMETQLGGCGDRLQEWREVMNRIATP